VVALAASNQNARMLALRLIKMSSDSASGSPLKTMVLGGGSTGVASRESNFRTSGSPSIQREQATTNSIVLIAMILETKVVLTTNPISRRRFDASSHKASLTQRIGMV
jgi:hypothetical protein